MGRPGPGRLATGQKRADGAEAVAHDQTPGHPLPQAALHVVGQAASGLSQLRRERGAPLPQDIHDLGGGPDRGLTGRGGGPGRLQQPTEIGAEDHRGIGLVGALVHA